jgi:hypothetical protein
LVEEVLIVGGLLLAQCVLSSYVLFSHHLLALGADSLAVVVVAGAAYAAFCLPFAVAFERYSTVVHYFFFFLLLLQFHRRCALLSSVDHPSSSDPIH